HSQNPSLGAVMVSAPQDSSRNSNLGSDCEQEGNRQGGCPAGIFPPGSEPYGLSYGEWSARWWQWLLQIPATTNPNLDSTGAHCTEGQSGHVWFLAGSFGTLPSPIIRNCTVPAGRSL